MGYASALGYAAALATATVSAPSPADAETQVAFRNGNMLLSDCEAEGYRRVYCSGYIAGMHDAISGALCAPPSIDQRQLNDLVIKYLREHPESRAYAAFSQVSNALLEAFPCPK